MGRGLMQRRLLRRRTCRETYNESRDSITNALIPLGRMRTGGLGSCDVAKQREYEMVDADCAVSSPA
jgi:hypothetical protein